MKSFLKSLTFGIIAILAVGFGIGVYILQAPSIEQPKASKFQLHTRTAVRGRPTVNSKPLRLYQRCLSFQSGSPIYQ